MELLTVRQVAQRLGLKEATVYRWVFDRKIETIRINRTVRINEATIDKMILDGITPARSDV